MCNPGRLYRVAPGNYALGTAGLGAVVIAYCLTMSSFKSHLLGWWYGFVGEPELRSNEDFQVVNAEAFVETNRSHGFTLLEVMVAVAILAIALVAILKANVQSLDTLVETRERTTASLLAASKMAEVEAAGAEDWSEFRGDFGEDYPGFTWQVETIPTELEGVIRVEVIVEREDAAPGNEIRIEVLLFAHSSAIQASK